MKTWNITFHRAPIYEETQIKAKTQKEAITKLLDVLDDVLIDATWEIKEQK